MLCLTWLVYNRKLHSKKDRKFLASAKKIASTSTEKCMHGAVIVRGGAVQAVGVNTFRNHPSNMSNPSQESSEHAEIAALRALGGSAKGATIYVARVNRQGEERMSKPCDACEHAIIEAGIKRVVFTIEGEITYG